MIDIFLRKLSRTVFPPLLFSHFHDVYMVIFIVICHSHMLIYIFAYGAPLTCLTCVFVKLPIAMEKVMDLLNEVNQQLEDVVEVDKDQVDYTVTSIMFLLKLTVLFTVTDIVSVSSCSSPPKRLLTGWRTRSHCCRC